MAVASAGTEKIARFKYGQLETNAFFYSDQSKQADAETRHRFHAFWDQVAQGEFPVDEVLADADGELMEAQAGSYSVSLKRRTVGNDQFYDVHVFDERPEVATGSMKNQWGIPAYLFASRTVKDINHALTLHQAAVEYLNYQ